MEYMIYFDDNIIGTAFVDRHGLYYFIRCCCKENPEPYRLMINTDSCRQDMGICPPGETITVRFPIKKVGEGELRFFGRPLNYGTYSWCVREDAACPYIDKLPQAYLRQNNGESYLFFKDPELSSPGNDRNR